MWPRVALTSAVLGFAGACATSATDQAAPGTVHNATTKATAPPVVGAPTQSLALPTTQVVQVSVPTTLISERLELAGTTATTVVLPQSCKVEVQLHTDAVGFAFDSASLSDDGQLLVGDLAKTLAGTTHVWVVGHSSSEGELDHNMQLSRARANTVENVLATLMPGVMFEADGRGPVEPIADNETEDGRSANRRVVVTAEVPREKCA